MIFINFRFHFKKKWSIPLYVLVEPNGSSHQIHTINTDARGFGLNSFKAACQFQSDIHHNCRIMQKN